MNLAHSLTTADVAVIAIYMVALILLAKKASVRQQSPTGYFLMSRRLTLPLFVATLVSTWYGGIYGVTEMTFRSGVYAFFTQGVFWYITYLLFAWLVVPRLLMQPAVMSLPDLMAQYVGPKSAKMTAIFNVLDVFPVAHVLAIGLFIQSLLPLPLWLAMTIGTGFVALYTSQGGLRSVVYTDCLQFIVMFLGVGAVVLFSLWDTAPLAEMWRGLPTSHKTTLGSDSFASFWVWGLIAMATLVDPNFYQRCFAAKNIKTARTGIILSTFCWFCFDVLTTLGALYARFSMPTAPAEHAYLSYAMKLLPSGFKGLFIASIASTIMSSLDSYLFTASSLCIRNLFPVKTENHVSRQRGLIVLIGMFAVVVAIQITGSFAQIWKFFGSLSGGCLVFPVMFILFTQTAVSDRLLAIALATSAVCSVFWELCGQKLTGLTLETFYLALLVHVLFFVVLRMKHSLCR